MKKNHFFTIIALFLGGSIFAAITFVAINFATMHSIGYKLTPGTFYSEVSYQPMIEEGDYPVPGNIGFVDLDPTTSEIDNIKTFNEGVFEAIGHYKISYTRTGTDTHIPYLWICVYDSQGHRSWNDGQLHLIYKN